MNKHLNKNNLRGEGLFWFTVWSNIVHHGWKGVTITEMWEVGHTASEVSMKRAHRKGVRRIQHASSTEAPPPKGSTISQPSTPLLQATGSNTGANGWALHRQAAADTKPRDTDTGLLEVKRIVTKDLLCVNIVLLCKFQSSRNLCYMWDFSWEDIIHMHANKHTATHPWKGTPKQISNSYQSLTQDPWVY